MSTTADDDFAAAQGPTKLANWTWNEQRKKLLWEALMKAQQVIYRVEGIVRFLCTRPDSALYHRYTQPMGHAEQEPGLFLLRMLSRETSVALAAGSQADFTAHFR